MASGQKKPNTIVVTGHSGAVGTDAPHQQQQQQQHQQQQQQSTAGGGSPAAPGNVVLSIVPRPRADLKVRTVPVFAATPVVLPVPTEAGNSPVLAASVASGVVLSNSSSSSSGTAAAAAAARPVMKQATLLKTQQPSSQQMRTFEMLREHIDVFLVEVYRCKLCKFHNALKAVMAQHMVEKHFPEPSISKQGSAAGKPQPRGAQALGTIVVRNEQGGVPATVRPVESRGGIQHTARSSQVTTSSNVTSANCAAAPVPDSVNPRVPSVSPTCSAPRISGEAGGNGPVHAQPTPRANTASVEGNALELLMGIGHENDPDVLKSQQSTTSQVSAGGVSGTGAVTRDADGESCESKQEGGVTAALEMSRSEAGGIVTVDEEEPYKTLRADDKKDSEGESEDDDDDDDDEGDAGPEDDEEDMSDDNAKQGSQEEPSGKDTLLKSMIPVQIGLGSPAPNIDIQEIANTASMSNPRATTITVLHHGQGNGPPTAMQFKKSKKSRAVIPTGESLGIASPFTSRAYKGKKLFVCYVCGARYKSRPELERHVKKKHQRAKKFLCEICGEELATRASVKYHVSKKHEEVRLLYKCGACDYCTHFAARMAIHKATHQSEFLCSLCKKSYVSAERLARHYSSPLHKNALNPLVCEHCGYSTKKRDNFLVHMRKHTGEKPYKCKVCNYASADGSTLKKHVMAKHSTIRPFKCEVCDFSCVDKKGLDIHSRKHTGERPFKCASCPYAAKRRCALNVHAQTHSKDAAAEKEPSVVARLQAEPTRFETVTTLPQASQQAPPQQTVQQTPQQNPQQEQLYTTMADYQPTTLATVEVQAVPETVVGHSLCVRL